MLQGINIHQLATQSIYHERKIYAVLAECNGPSNLGLGLGRESDIPPLQPIKR